MVHEDAPPTGGGHQHRDRSEHLTVIDLRDGAPSIRVAVQDRQRLFRDGMATVLEREPDLSVVVTASTSAELVSAAEDDHLDVVVLELDVTDWDPCGLVPALRRRHRRLAVVGTLPGAHADPSARAYQVGVRSVFGRDEGMAVLLLAVRTASSWGSASTSPGVLPLAASPLLTRREVEVLAAIGRGATTQQIAAGMGISRKTVENHKQRIFQKLEVQNQAHAVAVAMRRGLLTPEAAARLGS